MVSNIFFTNIDTSSPKGATQVLWLQVPMSSSEELRSRQRDEGEIVHVNIGYPSGDVQMIVEVTRRHLDKIENRFLVL